MAEVENMSHELEATIEAWNYANVELDRIDGDLETNAKHLVAARKSLVVAQRRIEQRLVDLYVNGEGDSTLEVILGSASLDELVDRLDSAERISEEDVRIVTDIRESRAEMRVRERKLARARAEQKLSLIHI